MDLKTISSYSIAIAHVVLKLVGHTIAMHLKTALSVDNISIAFDAYSI